MKTVSAIVPEKFSDFVFDWNYETYLLVGAYGSGKSHQVALKIILMLLQEKRKALVVREVYETIKDSCFDLIREILYNLDLLDDETGGRYNPQKVIARVSPLSFTFPNGSKIIFRGMDKPAKLKSINDISIVWLEECSEIKYEGYKELLGRLRTPNISLHFFLSCNPVSKENWVYRHFFKTLDDSGKEHTILDDEILYERGTIVKNGIYYHHSLPTDNPFLPDSYIKRLNEMERYDPYLYRIARWGRFGVTGLRVLPQFRVAQNPTYFVKTVRNIPQKYHFIGFDFGFEESFNAVVSMAVDLQESILYIYDEIYKNHVTDDKFANEPKMQQIKQKQEYYNNEHVEYNPIVADNEDPKAISYYRQNGFDIRSCRNKFQGSRLSNTRKIKRFKKIICSPKCINTIRELKELTYKRDSKGNVIYDDFNIDPHTFSAIWYALDTITVADVKEMKSNSYSGNSNV